jgi:rRNA-processing protein FCF1
MKQVILDTSFILSCIKQKIDFFSWISYEGIQILIPEQTIDELMGLGAQLALDILEKNKFKLVKIPGKDADNAIINFAKENPSAIVATLDAGLQKKVKNRKMVIRGKKKIEVI